MSTSTINPIPQASPPPLTAPDTAPPVNMLDRAVCITVELAAIGNRKRVPSTLIEVDADKDLLAVSQSLLDSDEWTAIKRKDQQIRHYLYSQCIQSGFRWGFYLVPIPSVERIESQLQQFAIERADLIEKFLLVYPAQVESAETRRRAIYNRGNYPPVDVVRKAFSFSWQYVTFGVPGRLRSISKSLFEAEQQKAKEKWAEAQSQVQQVLRVSMAELVDHMVDKLTGTRDGGKPKIFQVSMVSKVKEFLDSFADRNITDDGELDALVEQARRLMEGVDPASLRTNESTREYIRQGFVAIQGTLDGMIVDRPERAISFEDE